MKSYRDVLDYYRTHPEPKSATTEGLPCDRKTVGLLRRRVVQPAWITYIGKESNQLEEVERGLVHSRDAVLEEYLDPANDPWENVVVPILKRIPAAELAQAADVSERTIKALRNRRRRPSPRVWEALIRVVKEYLGGQS